MEGTPSIEIFAIGTELVMGRVQDTNSYWIAQQISDIGGNIHRITMLVDDLEDIISTLSGSIMRKTDVIITTGGLGPTPDDMTVQAVSELIGVRTELDEPTLEHFMKKRNLTDRSQISPNMVKMATVPEGAEVCQNLEGWAPCIHVKKDQSNIFILPGPPREMKGLFTRYIIPFISSILTTKRASARVMVNMFESEVSPLLEQVMQRYPNAYLKAYVAMRESIDHSLPVDIVVSDEDDESAQSELIEVREYLEELVAGKGKKLENYE